LSEISSTWIRSVSATIIFIAVQSVILKDLLNE
jgi:hypothetical protein